MIDFNDIETVIEIAKGIVTAPASEHPLRSKIAAVADARRSVNNAVGKISGDAAQRTTEGNRLERLRRKADALAGEVVCALHQFLEAGGEL